MAQPTFTLESGQLWFIGLVGRPGAGKDEQATRLAGALPKAAIINTGQVIRASADPRHRWHHDLASLRPYADRGDLPPDEFVWPLIERLLTTGFHAGQRTLIVTGAPRRTSHVERLDDYLVTYGQMGWSVRTDFLLLATPQHIATDRIGARSLNHLEEGVDVRLDDEPERQAKRRECWRAETWSMVQALHESGRLHVVDGTRPPDEVHQEILRELSRPESREGGEVLAELQTRSWPSLEPRSSRLG